jgi:preprotein translocase subunit SecD
LAEKTAATGLTEVTALLAKEKVYLRREAVLSNSDIVGIYIRRYYQLDEWPSGDLDEGMARLVSHGSLPSLAKYAISVVFSKEGARRLTSLSLEHRGRPIAILIDGEVILTFISMAPSNVDDSVQLSYEGVTRELGERLVGLLSRGCLSPDCRAALINRESRKPAVRIELRLAEGSPAKGLTEATVECSGERIFLRPEVLATNEDIKNAQTIRSRLTGLFDVDLTFTEEGAQRLARSTAEVMNVRIAILINGKVISTPVVRGPISSEVILSGFSTEAAEQMAGAMRRR